MKELKSHKQEAFAQALAFEDITKTDAYKRAYPTSLKWKPQSVNEKASLLASDVKVMSRIEHLKATVTTETIKELVYTREQSFKVFDENIAELRILLKEAKTLKDTTKKGYLINTLLKGIKDQEEQKAKLYSLFVSKIELDLGIKEGLQKFINRSKRIENEK